MGVSSCSQPIEAAAQKLVRRILPFGLVLLTARLAWRNRVLSILRGSLPFDLRQNERLCMP
jgi:hypothetical protein